MTRAKDDYVALTKISLHTNELRKQFMEEVYPQCGTETRFFHSETIHVRESRFHLWLLEHYGILDKALEEAEKTYLIEIIKNPPRRVFDDF